MRSSGPQLLFFLVVLAAAISLACGSPTHPIPVVCSVPASGQQNTTGVLQSITLCPAVADAKAFGGEVAFVATGTYNTDPLHVTPLSGLWNACDQNGTTTAVSVTQTGVAHCTGSASGTFTVLISDPTNCGAITACGGGCSVIGTARLTCP